MISRALLLPCGLIAASVGAQFDPAASPLLTTRGGGFEDTHVRIVIDDAFEGWFTLDSGADEHHLSKSAAEALGLQLEPFGEVGGVGASVRAFRVTASELRVGPLRLQSPRFTVADVPDRSDRQGLLGSGLFARAIVVYDTASATAAIYDPATWDAPPLEWLPCEMRDRRPFVRMQIEGKDALLEVDTGGGGCVLLCAPAVEKLGLGDGRAMANYAINGPFGSAPGRRGRLSEVRVGALRIEDVPVVCAVEAKGWLGETAYDGLIGAGLMCHTVVVFDYMRKRISLTDRRLFAALAELDDKVPPLRPAITAYTSIQATGEPDAVNQASYGKAWFPSDADGKHWIELSYAKPVRPQRMQIWGTLQQKGVANVRLITATGRQIAAVWNGAMEQQLVDGLGCTAGALEVDEDVVRVRLELDCSLVKGTNVVDAVALVDDQGTEHWACKAEASSSLKDIGRVAAFEPISALRAHADRLAAQGDGVGATRIRRLMKK